MIVGITSWGTHPFNNYKYPSIFSRISDKVNTNDVYPFERSKKEEDTLTFFRALCIFSENLKKFDYPIIQR